MYTMLSECSINLIPEFTFDKLNTEGIGGPEVKLKIERRITEISEPDKGLRRGRDFLLVTCTL